MLIENSMISDFFFMVVVGVAHTGDGESGCEAGEFKDHDVLVLLLLVVVVFA